MRASHGWAEIDAERKREILATIASGGSTRGPAHAEIDLTDRCNVACYFCNQIDVRTREQLSIEHLKALVDELAATGLKSVRLSGGGDPLFHPDAAEFLDHLERRGVVVDNLTTNGARLGPEIAQRLVQNRAREVIFSLNAAHEADYHRMMRVPPAIFGRVIENIRHLLDRRGGGAHPAVVVQFLLDQRNYRDLPRMDELGRRLGADRIAIGLVLRIPGDRIDPSLLLSGDVETGERLRPYLERVLERDREDHRLQLDFPVPSWNAMIAQIRAQLHDPVEAPLLPTAPSFREENGHCFFGWYSATIRGNGDLYPCCLLMTPDYVPLGNASAGRFADHWNGPGFTRLRSEMRDVLVSGDAAWDPNRYRVLRPQCVEHGQCWLKNIYFRGDDDFYRQLAAVLERMRRRARWTRWPRQAKIAARDLAGRLRRAAGALLA
jgi:MoaA/NifB/PqqE/SkfB family radical SAM enzyme